MKFSPVKKFILSACCAVCLLLYVPLASVVGTNPSDNYDYALAETNPVCEICAFSDDICEDCTNFQK